MSLVLSLVLWISTPPPGIEGPTIILVLNIPGNPFSYTANPPCGSGLGLQICAIN
jgi:hypothetical protein